MMIHLTPIDSILQEEENKILIIGDLLIDRTWKVNVTKISPEAPIPVVQKTSKNPINRPGGAGVTASFFKKTFPDVPLMFYTITSQDIAEKLNELGIEIVYQKIDEQDVIVKERYIDTSSKYHLLRVDNDDIIKKHSISLSQATQVIEENNIKCVIMIDYQKGIFSNELFVIDLIKALRDRDIPIYVDTRAADLSRFENVNIIKLNEEEYRMAEMRFGVSTPQMLANMLSIDNIIITRGERGAKIYSRGGYSAEASPNYDKCSSAPDVTGCGDAFDASFCYHFFVKEKCISSSLQLAVDKATWFAYQPIEERV